MSYKVKPEDVPARLIDAAETAVGIHSEMWNTNSVHAVADIINAAIEAGLVSPPTWAMRNDNGELVTIQRVFTSREAADDGRKYRYTVEHWKGQTE